MFQGWGADTAESFNCALEQSSGELLSGSTKLPVTGASHVVMHWLELLANIRRAVSDASWQVHIEGEPAIWDDDDESFDFPGLAESFSIELRNQSKNVTVADKALIGRSITEHFSDEGFIWNAAEYRMERTFGDIRVSVWFRPLTNNGEVSLLVFSDEMKEWLDSHHNEMPVTTASRIGLLGDYQLQTLDYRLGVGPFAWTGLTGDTAAEFQEQVVATVQTHGLTIAHMYQESPDGLFEFHERLDNMNQELLQFFVWRDRHDLAERFIASLVSRIPEDRRADFRQAVLDPSSSERPAATAVIAHAFGMQPPPFQNL